VPRRKRDDGTETDENEVAVDPQSVEAAPAGSDQPQWEIPGGRYIRGGRFDEQTGRHHGGEVVDAEGNVLATFKDDQENTGNPDDGTRPKE
jgi:hypothetical protein